MIHTLPVVGPVVTIHSFISALSYIMIHTLPVVGPVVTIHSFISALSYIMIHTLPVVGPVVTIHSRHETRTQTNGKHLLSRH